MEVYSQIERLVEEGRPLKNSIMELYSSLLPKRKFKSKGLN